MAIAPREHPERLLQLLEAAKVGRDSADHLCLAAELGHKAQDAVREGRYDDAWGFLHDQQRHYLQHAQKCRFTVSQTLALDGSLHVPMANIRRLEDAHDDALIHILYADATDDRATKSMAKLTRACVRRCKFAKTELDEVVAFVSQQRSRPDFRVIQLQVAEWRRRENE